jgi:hypothetical protein
MNKLPPIILVAIIAALAIVEALAPGHGSSAFPGRTTLIAAAGFVALVVLAKVILPPLLSKREERDSE